MTVINNNVLIAKWNDILDFFRVKESSNGNNPHYFDFYEFSYPNDRNRRFRLRIEVDLNYPMFDVYYGIFLKEPINSGKCSTIVNNEWNKIRIYIDKERSNNFSRSYGCTNDKDIDPIDKTQYDFWPYWIKVGERETELVAKDIEAIKDSLVKIGFQIVSNTP